MPRRGLGRVLVLSAALWLSLGAAAEQQQRHIDVHSIVDPVGVMSHVGEALGQAGRVLGLRIADSVADLVSTAFGHHHDHRGAHGAVRPPSASVPSWTRGDPGTLPAAMQGLPVGSSSYHYRQPYAAQSQQALTPQPSVISGILRLLGLDSSKLGAIALNGVIFLAQLISSSLTGRPGANSRARERGDAHKQQGHDEQQGEQGATSENWQDDDEDEEAPPGTPLSWILENPALKGSAALREVQNPDLAERLIADIQRRFPRARGPGGSGRRSRSSSPSSPFSRPASGEAGQAPAADTSCIQLLVCKAGPFLRGMQRSLRPVLGAAPGHAPGPHAPGSHAPVPPKGDTGGRDPADGTRGGPGGQAAEEVDEAWRGLSPVQRMFAHMPTRDEVLDQADTCALRFPGCKVSY